MLGIRALERVKVKQVEKSVVRDRYVKLLELVGNADSSMVGLCGKHFRVLKSGCGEFSG